MSGPASFRLSRETRDLLKQHQDFFSSVLDLYDGKGENPQKTPLKFKPSDAEAKTEAEVKDNGDVEVTFVIPIDDNEKSGDGRILLKDKFIFDPTQKVIKAYHRTFEHNGQGDVAAWKGWLGKYEELLKKAPKWSDPAVQSFGLKVARTFGQAMVDAKEQPLEPFKGAFNRERRYLNSLKDLIAEQSKRFDLTMSLRRDKGNNFQVLRNGESVDIVFKWIVDGDSDAANGRIWLKDTFSFKSGKFEALTRDWAVDSQAGNDPKLAALVESLKRQSNPDPEETKAFGENLYPELVPQKSPEAKDLIPLLAASVGAPSGESVFSGRNPSGPELDSAQKEVLGVLQALAQEDIAKRADHAQGLLNFSSKVDAGAEQKNLESIFTKLKAAQASGGGKNLKALLEGLELSDAGEQVQREKVLKLAAFGELNSLGQERDVEIRRNSLLHLAEGRLFADQGYPGTAMAIAELMKDDALLGAKAVKLIDLGQGRGSFGSKVEVTLGHFNKEVTKPATLVGFMAAPFAGAAFEMAGLRAAKWLYDAKKIQSIGMGTKLGSATFGMFGESLAFTAMHRGYERLWHSSDTAWKGAGSEILSSMLMFAGMRSVHAGTGWASSRMAEGKFNFSVKGREFNFGGRQGTAAVGPNFAQPTPTGRLLTGNPWVPEAGIGTPALSKLGQVSAGTMNHLGGIFAMQASGWASRQVGLMPDNGQGFGANFFDATVMYGQAMVGANLANRATMGRLQPALGEFKMRIEGFDPKAGYTPIVPEKIPGAGSKLDIGALFQKIVPKRSSAAQPKPKIAGGSKDFGARVRESLSSAREWLSNLAPAKVRELETKLADVEKAKSEAEATVASKGQEISDLEAKVTQLTGELGTAQGEAASHKSDAETKGTRISDLERDLGEQKTKVGEKDQELEAANEALGREKSAKEAAETKLRQIEENAEAADLGLGFADPQSEIGALRQKIQILAAEKGEAEVQSAALGSEAVELRGKLKIANEQLERNAGLQASLTKTEKSLTELQGTKAELEKKLEELKRNLSSANEQNTTASAQIGELLQKVSDLEVDLGRRDELLKVGAEKVNELGAKVEATTQEAQLLANRLRESDENLDAARRQVATEKSRVQVLEKAKAGLERDKAEIQGKLDTKSGEASELSAKLGEAEKSLTQVRRELKDAQHALETAETVKRSKETELGRLRDRIEEVQKHNVQREAQLATQIRELETTIKKQVEELQTAASSIEQLTQGQAREKGRADEAEARAAELLTQHEALAAEHEKTKKELANAERLKGIAESDVAGKSREIERINKDRDDLRGRLEALRESKSKVDSELTQKKAELVRQAEKLKDTERLLEEERNKEPVIDVSTEVELQAEVEALTEGRNALSAQIRTLETSQAELQTNLRRSEAKVQELERELRFKQTDLEMAEGSARDFQKDLIELKERSNKEIDELRQSSEAWRKKAGEIESEKVQLGLRNESLHSELGRANERIEALGKDLSERAEELKAAKGQNEALSKDQQAIVEENAELRRQVLVTETEMATAQAEAQGKIDILNGEKTTLESQLTEKQGTVERLRKEVDEKRKAVEEANRQTRDAKDEARKEKAGLEEEKRKLGREVTDKTRELKKAEDSLAEHATRIEELEAEIAQVRETAAGETQRLSQEKVELNIRLEAKDQELGRLNGSLAESQARAEELSGQLTSAREALVKERAALATLKGEHEALTARSAGEAQRLRSEAAEAQNSLGEVKREAEAAQRQADLLQSAIDEVKATAAREVEAANGLATAANQKFERADGKAGEILSQLEALKTTAAAEAESLRQEVEAAGRKLALAEGKVQELERAAVASKTRISALETEIKAAEAKAEALEAPASQHEAAEATANRLKGELAAEKERSKAADERANASAERVRALESDLAAQRQTNSQDAIRHQHEAELHEAKARAADERATAAEERAIAAENKIEAEQLRADAAERRAKEAEGKVNAAEIEGRRIKAAADSASTVDKGVLRQRDVRIGALEADVRAKEAEIISLGKSAEQAAQALEARAKAAEARAIAAEERATNAEKEAAEIQVEIEQMASSLREAREVESTATSQVAELMREKSGYEHKIQELTETIGNLEKQGTDQIAKRREIERELETSRARVGELEAKVRNQGAEVDRLRDEVSKVWEQGQDKGQDAIKTKQESEQRIEELLVEIVGLEEQLKQAKDEQRTVELLAASEAKLEQQVKKLTEERTATQRKLKELETKLAEAGAVDFELGLAADNLRSAGVNDGFIHNADPRVDPVMAWAQNTLIFRGPSGEPRGEAKIVAGGAQGDSELRFSDGSWVSSRTSVGVRDYQQDGSYISRFTLPDGREVKVLVAADGAGGHSAGEVASGAFLQGVHARVAEASREGRVPSAGELFEHGEMALAQQKSHLVPEKGKQPNPTGAATILVLCGDEGTVASKGDANLIWARADKSGEYEVLGLTETDAMGLPSDKKYNNLVRGLGVEANNGDNFLGKPHHNYGLRGIRPGDRFLLGSDGFHGATTGYILPEQTSPSLRMLKGFDFGEVSQETFGVIREGLKRTLGHMDVAMAWHDLAVENMRQPRAKKNFFGQELKIDPELTKGTRDNVVIIDFQQGEEIVPNAKSIIPSDHVDLFRVPSFAEAREQAALAARSPQPKAPSPIPPPPSGRTKAVIEGEFFQKYLNALGSVYGTVVEQGSARLSPSAVEATRQFTELYLRYPELEGQINPELLNAADRSGQIRIFDGAKKFLDDLKKMEPAKAIAAKDILKSIEEIRKVFPVPTHEHVAQVTSAYGYNLQRLYGNRAADAAVEFAKLFLAAPGIDKLFNPDNFASPARFNLAYFFQEMSGKIKESGVAYQKPTPQEIEAVAKEYQADLQRVFGMAAPQGAELFAGLFKTLPQLKATYNPKKIQPKKFIQQLIRNFSIDALRGTDLAPSSDASLLGAAANIKNFHEDGAVVRKAIGWDTPASLETGKRAWVLDPTPNKLYVGGRREGDLIFGEETVSAQHITIRFMENGKWQLEEVHSVNGTFVNGKALKKNKVHPLNPGDRIRLGGLELEWRIDDNGHGVLSDLVPQNIPPQGPAAPPPRQSPPPPPPPVEPTPASATGGVTIPIPKGHPFVIGYEQIPDFLVSPEHVLVHWTGKGWIIQDRGSAYGTELNGTNIQADVSPRGGRPPGPQYDLKVGDQVKLGNAQFRFSGDRLVQIGGSIIPPSSKLIRPSTRFSVIELKEGQNEPLLDAQGARIGAIQWDARSRKFQLQNSSSNPQIWVQHQGQYYPLKDACLLADGTIFGIGPNHREAQYFVFNNNVVTPVGLQNGIGIHSPAASVQPPIHLDFSAVEYPEGLVLGRQHFRNHDSVSSKHLEFRYHEGKWWVRDTGSTNGTNLLPRYGATDGEARWISDGQPNVPIRKRNAGQFTVIQPGNVLRLGAFDFLFNSEGPRFALDEIVTTRSEPPHEGPISAENLPSSYRPSPTAGSRDPAVDLQLMAQGLVKVSLGDLRNLVVTRKKDEPGLFYANAEQKMSGEYVLNLGTESGLMARFFSKDLFQLEKLEHDRYRVTNISAKNGLTITNGRGANREVAMGGGHDQIVAGDTIVLDNGKLKIVFTN